MILTSVRQAIVKTNTPVALLAPNVHMRAGRRPEWRPVRGPCDCPRASVRIRGVRHSIRAVLNDGCSVMVAPCIYICRGGRRAPLDDARSRDRGADRRLHLPLRASVHLGGTEAGQRAEPRSGRAAGRLSHRFYSPADAHSLGSPGRPFRRADRHHLRPGHDRRTPLPGGHGERPGPAGRAPGAGRGGERIRLGGQRPASSSDGSPPGNAASPWGSGRRRPRWAWAWPPWRSPRSPHTTESGAPSCSARRCAVSSPCSSARWPRTRPAPRGRRGRNRPPIPTVTPRCGASTPPVRCCAYRSSRRTPSRWCS